jgi:hypothetical protein
MKLFQLNFFGIVLLLIILLASIFVPSLIIQAVWNSIYSVGIERDLSIEIWQAALLWGAVLTLVYMSGVFQFKLNFKTLDSIDLDSIPDPGLREEIEKLKAKAKEKETEQTNKEE